MLHNVLQPDVAICGGISEALKIAQFGEIMGRMVVPHCSGLTVQSAPLPHACPGMQRLGHELPQSMSLSPPFFTVSPHVGD